MQLLPILVLLFVVLWLLVIRPQRRRQAEQRRTLDGMAPGQEVMTAGGLYGTIRAVDDDDVRIEIAPDVEVRVARRAIAAVLTDDDEDDESGLAEIERAQEEAEAEIVAARDSAER